MRSLIYRALAVFSALALLAGAIGHFIGDTSLSNMLWVIGALPVAASILVSIIVQLIHRDAGIDVIALLAMAGAIVLGEPLAAAVIGLMFASGRVLEDYAEGKARRTMSALLERAPRAANRYQGDVLVQVPVAQVRPGDRLLIRGGEVVPVDGRVASGTAVLDESALTGESLPARRPEGDAVRSGVINAAAPFDLLATTSAADSTFAGIVRLVETAQKAKAPSARLADRYALLFLPLTLVLAGMAWMLSGDPVRALAVLVVATPCPLILAVPVAMVSGMSRCAARGVLVKGGGALEQLAQGRVLFFDKTGTLTAGHARLTAIEVADSLDPNELLRMSASLEQVSQHVLAEAIVSFARRRGLVLAKPSDVQEEHGAGLSGTIEGHRVIVGSYAFVTRMAAPAAWVEALRRRMRREAATGVFVAIDGRMSGALLLGDEIRLDTPRAIRLLRRAGIARIVMLTGDQRDIAEIIGEALGVDEVMAHQTPDGKLAAIKAAKSVGTTIMVGDGINDAPALAAADVGVAMGARGAAASSEAAGVVLLVDRLDHLAEAFLIARRTRKIALESIIAGMGLSLLAMIVAAVGYLPPVPGAVLQEGIDVAVILNALRALHTGVIHVAGKLDASENSRLAAEHHELGPVLDRIRTCADHLPLLAEDALHAELAELDGLLRTRLLPHEHADETSLYPRLERMLGGDDPLAPLSRTHREILRLGRLFQHMTQDLPQGRLPPETVQDLQRVLYGLDAILRLHFAQEEEIYQGVTEAIS